MLGEVDRAPSLARELVGQCRHVLAHHEALHVATARARDLLRERSELEAGFANDENLSLVENLFAAVRALPGMRKSHPLDTLLIMTRDVRELLVAQSKRLQAMQNAALIIRHGTIVWSSDRRDVSLRVLHVKSLHS